MMAASVLARPSRGAQVLPPLADRVGSGENGGLCVQGTRCAERGGDGSGGDRRRAEQGDDFARVTPGRAALEGRANQALGRGHRPRGARGH